MSTKERLHLMIDDMTEEQANALFIVLGVSSAADNESDDVDAVRGILHSAANPELIPLEEGAWERAVAERYGNV